jgi:hypothetical protein
MQDDGNLVIYNSQNQPIWASNTVSSCGDDTGGTRRGDSLINNTTMPLGTTIKSNNQCFSLNAQSDGNLVLYRKSNGQALWDTKTYGRNVNRTIFQNDGNLVIYNTSNQAVWASGTDRRGGTRVTVQDDGNFVMYNAQNQALWATNTVTSCKIQNDRQSKKNVDAFVSQWNGKTRITRYDLGGDGYDGQCVTLIARYLQDYYNASKSSLSIENGRGTAASVGRQFPNDFLPLSDTSDPIPGSIISFPQMAPNYGHVALVVSSQRNGNTLTLTILESNMGSPAPNSTVKQNTITINLSNYTVSGSDHFGSVQWVNPKN